MLHERMISCGSTEAVVTVMSYADGVMTGNLRHPRLRRKEEFRSLSQMILLLNGLLDLEKCLNPPPPLVPSAEDDTERIGVFQVQVLFREHNTWQGRLIWQDENKEFVFRSVMELIQMLDEILAV